MALQPPKRLPSRFRRKVQKSARRDIVRKRASKRRAHSIERTKRSFRRIGHSIAAKKHLLLCIAFGIIAIAMAIASVFVLSSPVLTVQSIRLSRSNPRLDIEDVQRRLFPLYGQHMFRVSLQDIEHILKENIEDLSSVTMSKFYPSELRIFIELDPLFARLKIDEPDKEEAEEIDNVHIDFLTEEGVYIVTATPDNTKALPTISVRDWGVRPLPGELLIPSMLLKKLNAAEVLLLRRLGEQVRERTIYVRALEFHMKLDRHTLWFDSKNPIQDQIERYLVFLEEQGADAAREYIDLRLSDRVVYR